MLDRTANLLKEGKHVASIGHGNSLLVLECHEDIDTIIRIRDEWQHLENTCDEKFTFFQTYDWCLQYYKHFSHDLNNRHCPLPQVFVLRMKGEPIMLWPMMRIQSRTGLKLLTTATEPLGQYSSLLYNDQYFDSDLGREVFALVKQYCEADCISLNHYLKNSMVDTIVGEQGIREHSEFEALMLDTRHHKNWESYCMTLSKSQRKDRRRRRTKLEGLGRLDYHVHPAGTAEYRKTVAWSLAMKSKWLEETGRKPGLVGDYNTKAMFDAMLASQDPDADVSNGALVHALELNGKTIATEIGMHFKGHYYSYLGAIDMNWKEFGPGKVQMELAQQWAFEKGIKCFDLLHDPSEYKKSWITKRQPLVSRNIPLTLQGYGYAMIWKTHVRPRLKAVYHFAGADTRSKLNRFLGFIANK